MIGWNKISLYKFQQIELINERKDVPDIDKTLFSTCVVFDYTEFELDNLPLKKVDKLTREVKRIFDAPLNQLPVKRIGKYFINYDVSKMTFGQYIELSFFLSSNLLQNAHFIIASASSLLLRKNNSGTHRKRADYFLKQPVASFIGALPMIMQSFSSFNNEYKALFSLDKEVYGNAGDEFFNKRYGWIYSASQVAEYERVTLNEAFKLPVRQAFNDLAYLKAKAKYESDQLKQSHARR